MKLPSILTLLLCCAVNLLHAQNATLRTYYTNDNKETKDDKKAFYYRDIEMSADKSAPLQVIERYTATNQIKLIGYFNNINEKKFVGSKTQAYLNGKVKAKEKYAMDGILIDTAQYYHPNGKLKIAYHYPYKIENYKTVITDTMILIFRDSLGIVHLTDGNGYAELYVESDDLVKAPKEIEKGTFNNHKRNGEWTGYFLDRKYHFVEQYDNGKIITGVSRDSLNKEYAYDESNYMVDPQYPGGIIAIRRFIGKNYSYPSMAIKNNVSGTIVVSFTIDTQGKMRDLNVENDLGAGTGEEALNVLKKTFLWQPGKKRGIPVPVKYTLPINLDLQTL